MASTINANTLSALDKGLKYNYANVVKDLIRKDSALLDMFMEDKGFNKDLGGRSLIWPLVTDRPFNNGVGSEDSYFPGFSGSTNDDIDRITPVEASLGRAYAYATVAFTEQMMADVHKDFELFKGWGYARHIKTMQDDFRMYLERMALGDGTGILGVVNGAPSLSSGNTVVTLKPASTIDARGVLGTQRLYKNMKVSIIRAADWATSARTAKIHSNVGGSGTAVQKVVAVSGIHDVTASPTITLSGDLVSSAALADGDIIVEGNSRVANSTGGNASDDSGLYCFQGLFAFIDDGTLTTKLYNLTRSSYTQLNSQVDLSSTGRNLTWQMLQVMFDKLYRRRGSQDTEIENEYMLLTERSVRTNYVAADGEAAKRYVQEDKAKKLVAGFKDVTLAFIGNDTLLPWVALNTMPYGHALLMRKSDLKVMWDIPPGIVTGDGLTQRQITGKPVYYVALQAVGNFKKDEPWLDGRISGLNGTFSA
jgi:hypothetical protein